MLRRLWTPTVGEQLLSALENPELQITFLLPQSLTLIGLDGEELLPRLCFSVVPRKVKWETGKFGCLTKISESDGSCQFKYNPEREIKYKDALTIGKIVVLIRTRPDEQPEIPRALAGSTRQGYMGAEQRKYKVQGPTPAEVIVQQHPGCRRRINHCMNKWHKKTAGKFCWPAEGTFDMACCEEVEVRLRGVETKDSMNRLKKKNKRNKEREILGWFKKEGCHRQMVLRESQLRATAPNAPIAIDPPPYPPSYEPPQATKAGIYPMMTANKTIEGEMTGAFTLTLKESRKGEEKSVQTPREGKEKEKSKSESEVGEETEGMSGESCVSEESEKEEDDRGTDQDKRNMKRPKDCQKKKSQSADATEKARKRAIKELIEQEQKEAAWLERERLKVAERSKRTDRKMRIESHASSDDEEMSDLFSESSYRTGNHAYIERMEKILREKAQRTHAQKKPASTFYPRLKPHGPRLLSITPRHKRKR